MKIKQQNTSKDLSIDRDVENTDHNILESCQKVILGFSFFFFNASSPQNVSSLPRRFSECSNHLLQTANTSTIQAFQQQGIASHKHRRAGEWRLPLGADGAVPDIPRPATADMQICDLGIYTRSKVRTVWWFLRSGTLSYSEFTRDTE